MKYTDKLNMGLPESQDEIDIEELNRNFKVLDVESNRIEVSETKPTNPNVDVWVKPSAKPVALATQEFVNEKVNPVSEQVTALSEQIVQSDWAENDPDSPAYIKNRFGGYDTLMPVADITPLADVTFSFEADVGGFIADVHADYSTIGEPTGIVRISWDGTDYDYSLLDLFDVGAAGNLSLTGEGPDTGEPFLFIPNPDSFWIVTQSNSASHSIAVRKVELAPVKIPEKYLPTPPDPLPPITPEDENASLTAIGGKATWIKPIIAPNDPSQWTAEEKEQRYAQYNAGQKILFKYAPAVQTNTRTLPTEYMGEIMGTSVVAGEKYFTYTIPVEHHGIDRIALHFGNNTAYISVEES